MIIELANILARAHSIATLTVQPRIAFGMTVLLALIVAAATLTPSDNLPSAPGSDKLHHFLDFGAVAFPAAFARPRASLWLVIVVSAYGAAIDIIQPYVGRHEDIMDGLFNAAGAFCGACLGVVSRRSLFLRMR